MTVNTDLLASLGLLQGSNQSSSSSSSSSSNVAQSAGELGQQDFLKLMTTQLSNQDPMNPMDNGQFLAQIAQFGTVSGISDLNTSFQSLASSMSSSQGLQASSLVGQVVTVPSTKGVLPSQGSMVAEVDVPASTDNVSVDILDASGQVMKHLDLGPTGAGMAAFTWDGTTTDGTQAAPGTYTIKASALQSGDQTALDVYGVDSVSSVTLGANGASPQLNLTTLGSVDLSAVKQIM